MSYSQSARAAVADESAGSVSSIPGGSVVDFRRWSRLRWFLAFLFLALSESRSLAFIDVFRVCTAHRFDQLNRQLVGQVLDFTFNHGVDRRIYSPSLGCKRDTYVYLPPGYDGVKKFPSLLWLHGLGYDEKNFLDLVPAFDRAICLGYAPPLVIIAVDGTINGRPSLFNSGSFYLNGVRGNFEFSTIHDIWGFAKRHFAIRPEREAHAIGGASMGAFGSYNLAFKYRQEFGLVIGLLPPLNLRFGDCQGRYLVPYQPNNFALRNVDRRSEVIAVFSGVIWIRSRRLLDPLVGRWPRVNPTEFVSRENPYEMLDRLNIQPDDFKMFIGYAKRDEFNMDAQTESFLAKISSRGFRPTAYVAPEGRHNIKAALTFMPPLCEWLQTHLRPYVPAGYPPPGSIPSRPPFATVRRTGFLGFRSIPVPTGLPYFDVSLPSLAPANPSPR